MADAQTTIGTLRELWAAFIREREWAPFHSPKNLAMALAVEAAELMEHFLWVDNEASRGVAGDRGQLEQVADEVADVTWLVLALCNTLGLDLSDAVLRKLAKNAL